MCSCVQAAVPDGDDQVRVADGQRTGEVDGVRASECVRTCQLAGVLFYGRGELDRAHGGPVAVPCLLGATLTAFRQVETEPRR